MSFGVSSFWLRLPHRLSAIPGVIGPKRQFSPGQIYQYVTCLVPHVFTDDCIVVHFQREKAAMSLIILLGLTYFFLMGALAPLAGWLINRQWPTSFFKYVK